MAAPNLYESVGGSIGPAMVTKGPWRDSGQRWYVRATGGSDAASPRGLDRVRPLATVAQAYTNAAAGDTINFLEGHQEILAAAQVIAKGLYFVSEGSGSTRAQFIANGAVAMFDVTAAGCRFENLYFPQSTVAPTARLRVAAAECHVLACDFDCGALDTASALKFITSAATARVENCRFLSTGTLLTAQPAIGLEVANAMTGLDLVNVSFSGGSVGWSDYACKLGAAVTRLQVVDLSLLLDSDFILATGSTYRIHRKDASGSARMVIAA